MKKISAQSSQRKIKFKNNDLKIRLNIAIKPDYSLYMLKHLLTFFHSKSLLFLANLCVYGGESYQYHDDGAHKSQPIINLLIKVSQ